MLTINSALRWWSKNRSDVVALSLGGDELTYGAWLPWIDRVAARLEQLGVRPGDRINACAANSLEYCTLAMAAMRGSANLGLLSTRRRAVIAMTSSSSKAMMSFFLTGTAVLFSVVNKRLVRCRPVAVLL